MRIVVVTGLSGAGKSTVLRALEDLHYFCVDNLPLPMLHDLVALLTSKQISKLALVVDAREGEYLRFFDQVTQALVADKHTVEILFLDAPDDTLFRRFSETRRRHPLAGDDLGAGIAKERTLLAPLRDKAHAVLDTDPLTVHQLKGIVQEHYGKEAGCLSITLLSFGYKHGLPPEADVVFDVRFLPNPYFIEALSALSGLHEKVAQFVLHNEGAQAFLTTVEVFLRTTLPQHEREGKAYLTIAIGCTGGRHRSVAVAEALGQLLAAQWKLTVRHRDLDQPDPR